MSLGQDGPPTRTRLPEPPAGTPRTGGTDTPNPLVALQGRMRELLDGVRERTVRGG